MKKITATKAPEFRTPALRNLAWGYAAILTVMAVGQLFAYEKFIPLLQVYQLPGDYGTAVFVASVVVVAEVFALPYLLRMRLSPLMRHISKACCIIAPIIWLGLALQAYATIILPVNGGMFGTRVDVPIYLQSMLALMCISLAVYLVTSGTRKKV